MKKVLVLMLMVCFMAVMAAPVVAAGNDTININTASVDELTQLQKVGPKTAENIVAYRDANGPLKQSTILRTSRASVTKFWN
jgi:competence protein ComEA